MSAEGAKVGEQATLSTAAAKLLPEEARTAWQRQFVKFACDDLNGLYDRLAVAAIEKAPCPPDIRERLELIVRGLSWSREAVIGHVWTLIEEGLEQPEDAFAPALILSGLAPDDPKAQKWLAAQVPNICAAIGHAQR